MPRQPRRSTFVSVFMALSASAAAIAAVGATYFEIGDRLGGARGAFVGVAAVFAGTLAAGLTLHARRAHHRALASWVTAIAGLIAYAGAWVLRIAPDAVLALDLRAVVDEALALATPRPLELWLLLGAELGILAAIVFVFARTFRARVCYWCDSACVVEREVARRADAHPADVRLRLSNRSWRYFERLGAPAPGARHWLRFDLSGCTCGLTRALTIVRVRRFRFDTVLVSGVRLKPEDVRAIRGYGLPEVSPWYGYGNDSWDSSESGATA